MSEHEDTRDKPEFYAPMEFIVGEVGFSWYVSRWGNHYLHNYYTDKNIRVRSDESKENIKKMAALEVLKSVKSLEVEQRELRNQVTRLESALVSICDTIEASEGLNQMEKYGILRVIALATGGDIPPKPESMQYNSYEVVDSEIEDDLREIENE